MHKHKCELVAKVTDKQQAQKQTQKTLNRKDSQKQDTFEAELERVNAPPVNTPAPAIICLRCAAECIDDLATKCKECEAVQYCSDACRVAHATTHERHCTVRLRRELHLRNEEARQLQEQMNARDAPRRLAEAAAEAEALAARIAAVQAEEAAVAAAENEEAKRRQAAIAAARAARPDVSEYQETLPGPSHRQPKERVDRPEPSMEEQLEHQHWAEEKPFRSAAFDAKQQAEHEAAVNRKAKAKSDAQRQLEAEIDKDMQARLHFVPPKPELHL